MFDANQNILQAMITFLVQWSVMARQAIHDPHSSFQCFRVPNLQTFVPFTILFPRTEIGRREVQKKRLTVVVPIVSSCLSEFLLDDKVLIIRSHLLSFV